MRVVRIYGENEVNAFINAVVAETATHETFKKNYKIPLEIEDHRIHITKDQLVDILRVLDGGNQS